MKALKNLIKERMLSEALSDIDSDSISYSTDIWFRNNDALKNEFYSVVNAFHINGKVPDDKLIDEFAKKIDLRNFCDFVLGDIKTNLATDTTDYLYILKKIIQTAKSK